MVEERRNDREMTINILFSLIYMLFAIKVLFSHIILYDFVSSTKNTFCELFKSLRYMYILKIRRGGIKRIKTLHSAEKKTPMTLHFYNITTTQQSEITLFVHLSNRIVYCFLHRNSLQRVSRRCRLHVKTLELRQSTTVQVC